MRVTTILRDLAVAAILASGMICLASDQSVHNCRDDSVVSSTRVATPGAVRNEMTEHKPHSVKLSWTPSKDVVKGYIIERREPGGEYKPLSLLPVQGTSCIDYDVVAGHTYYYRARSVGISGSFSVPCGEAKATVEVP